MATHDWFPEIFGSFEAEATLITLVKTGTSLQSGVAPGQLSSLALLPLAVEILRATPYLPPSYIGPFGASPRLTSPDGGLFAQSDPTSQHVYMAIHTSKGYSPLHQAVTGFIASPSPWPSQRITSPGNLSSTVIPWINHRPGPDIRRSS